MMLKIACYGYVVKDGGSVASANFLVIEELLKRGYKIDFFGWKDFNQPVEFEGREHLALVTLPNKSVIRPFLKKLLPRRLHNWFDNNIAALLQNFYSNWRDQRLLQQTILSEHQRKQYDLVLFLGLYATLRINGIPTVSWVQGPPQTEWTYTEKLRDSIIQLCGAFTYYKVALFYLIKNRKLALEIKHTDLYICGSLWAKEQMIHYGISPELISYLQYPIDTELFQPCPEQSEMKQGSRKTLLWLGRIDPRKRFDLLMEAYEMLLQERKDVHLIISGAFRYAKGYKKLLDEFSFPDHVEYYSGIKRQAVPDLIRRCSLLVQSSEGENFGTSVAESLCCGIPVVVGTTNGTKDFISPSSFVFDEYTPAALKATLVKALDAIDQHPQALAEDARRTAEKNFQISVVIDKLEHFFQEALTRYGKSIAHQVHQR